MQLPKLKSGGKKEPKQYIDENPFEALMGMGSDVVKSIKSDVGKDLVFDAWDQFLGTDKSHNGGHSGGEMHAGEEVDLAHGENQSEKHAKPHKEAGNDYHREIVHSGERTASRENQEIAVKVQEILIEIKQLANSSGELKEKVQVLTIEQIGENPGVYHLNFMEEVLKWIRDARMNVEDSLAWFHALRSKKASRQYGVMAKKGGTSFTLSNERTAATQTG